MEKIKSHIQSFVIDNISSAKDTLRRVVRMFAYSKSKMLDFILINVLNVFGQVMRGLSPKFSGDVIDAVSRGDSEAVTNTIVYLSIAYIVLAFVNMYKETKNSGINMVIINSTKVDFFSKILRKDVEFFEKNETGALLEKINSDIQEMQSVSTWNMQNMVYFGINIFINMYLLWNSSRIILIVLILLSIPVLYLRAKSEQLWRESWEKKKKINEKNTSCISQAFSNVKVVKAFNTIEFELSNLLKRIEEKEMISNQVSSEDRKIDIITEIISRVLKAFVMIYSGILAIEGVVTAGEVSTIILCADNLTSQLDGIKWTLSSIYRGIVASKGIFEKMDEPSKLSCSTNPIVKDNLKGDMKFEKVSFRYPSKPDVLALKSVSFEIKSGESVGIVGSSGSGKSTIISLLMRHFDPSEGKIMIDGEELKNYDRDSLYNKIGYVPQEPILYSGTIEENIRYDTKDKTEEDLKKVIALSNSNFIFDTTLFPDGLKTLVGEKGSQLSGGQKQRIAIARALLKDPKILIFDEATSALDAESEHQVQHAVESIVNKRDRTMLIIAHRLSTIKDCSKLLAFDKGELVEQGSHFFLMKKNGFYKELMDKQVEGAKDKKSNDVPLPGLARSITNKF